MRTYCAAGIGPPFADPTVSGVLARRPTNDFSCNVLFLRQRTAAGGLSNHRGCMSTQAVGIWMAAQCCAMRPHALWTAMRGVAGSPVENDPAVNFSLLHCQSPCNGSESEGRLLLQG